MSISLVEYKKMCTNSHKFIFREKVKKIIGILGEFKRMMKKRPLKAHQKQQFQ